MQHGLRLTNLSAVTETGVTRGDLWIDGGRFANGGNGDWPAIDCNGRIAFPGMIDLLQHGMFRHLYSDATPGAVAETSDFLLSTGTTGFLPSIGCQTPDRLMPVLAQLARDCDTATGARALGIHSEGPCFAFPGAHNPQNVQPPSVDLARAMIDAADGRLVSVTLAPELPGAQGFATTLRDSGVALHLGHSDAPPDDVPRYLDWGVRAVTHVFNVMPPKPYDGMGLHPFSLPEALLAEPGLALGLICDGIHVHPRLVQLLAQLPLNRVFLETDAMKFAGAEDTSLNSIPATASIPCAAMPCTTTAAACADRP